MLGKLEVPVAFFHRRDDAATSARGQYLAEYAPNGQLRALEAWRRVAAPLIEEREPRQALAQVVG